MTAARFRFYQRWLTYANVLTVGVGLLVAFAGNSVFFELHNTYTQAVFFDGVAFTPEVLRLKNWLFGIIGGTIVGFHVLMIYLSEYAIKRREDWAYRAMWAGLGSWFVIDSGISLYFGVVHNIILINLAALLLIGYPLAMLRHAFRSGEAGSH